MALLLLDYGTGIYIPWYSKVIGKGHILLDYRKLSDNQHYSTTASGKLTITARYSYSKLDMGIKIIL